MTDVVERLLAQAARTPDGAAVVEAGRTVSYAAFVERAAAYAARFDEIGRPRVLIALEKGADAYAAMFGTLMAGGVYAPVNIASPPARLTHIRDLFDPRMIVAAEPLGSQLADGSRLLLPLAGEAGLGVSGGRMSGDAGRGKSASLSFAPDLPHPTLADAGATFSRRWETECAPDALAYVIFTSGSTGAPKGVAISRAALAHYVDWLGPALAIGPGDRMSQHPNIGFDLSVLDIFGALCFGAALHPFVGPSARLLPARKVREAGITIWNSVPSVVSAMETAGELDAAHLRSVRLFTFCGEVLQRHQIAKLFAARPDALVMNTYGPTEATVAMTCRRLTAKTFEDLCCPSAPLGEPIGDMRLDLAGGGDEGEIVISGPQLAAGYWDDPGLTAATFRDLSTAAGPVRAFYTGDHAKRVGGELYFLGRADDMVKLHGHRIHLGEIARALDGLGWSRACVFETGGEIHAVVEATDGLAFDEAGVRAAIAQRLDSYFVPATIRCVRRLPRTGNDKIDVAAVKAGVDVVAGTDVVDVKAM